MQNVWILLAAIIIDYILGDPHSWPHPVVLMGKCIKKIEDLVRGLKLPLKLGGFIIVAVTISITIICSTAILYIAEKINIYVEIGVVVYLLYTTLAGRCMADEATKVAKSLEKQDLLKSRKLLSYLVGRDTTNLSFDEIKRALIETTSENTIDGVLAPLFYIGIGFIIGIPVQLALVYKAINTMDSMIGYIQQPYKDVGFAAAKIDDIVNFIPARIGSIIMLFSGLILGYDFKNGFKILLRDRKNHKSPNCGYPEAATAGMLNIQLGGTNTYFGESLHKPTIGNKTKPIHTKHIYDTVKILYMSTIIFSLVSVAILISI